VLAGPEATVQLALAAAQCCSSLRPLDVAALAARFLPAMLPAAWRRAGAGRIAGAAGQEDEAPLVTWEWLQALWQWLAAPHRRGDWPLLARSGWPVLPAAGGRLVPLAPSRARCAAVLPGADWPVGLGPILQRLGVSVLDMSSYELPTEALLAGGYVRSGCGGGVALALQAVLCGGDSSGGAVAALDTARLEELPPADRRLLRGYLAQPIWFQQRGGGSAAADPRALAAVLLQLPLFELANNGSFGAGGGGGRDDEGNGGSAGGSGEEAPAIFVPLQEGCALAPEGVLWAALDERFVDGGPPGAALAAVLASHLGVPAPSAPEVYRTCVLPRLGALEPALRDAAVATLLRALPALEAADAGFVRGLRQVRAGWWRAAAMPALSFARPAALPAPQPVARPWSLPFACSTLADGVRPQRRVRAAGAARTARPPRPRAPRAARPRRRLPRG
jgi:hypothetical protein